MTGPRMAIALVAISCAAGCPGKTKDSSTVTTGQGTVLTHLVKKIALSWGFSIAGTSTDVFLAATDETGAQVSHPVGRYAGTCEPLTAAKAMNALIAAKCAPAGMAGVELHAVQQNNEVIILEMSAATADPMAREEIKRISFTFGAAIEAVP